MQRLQRNSKRLCTMLGAKSASTAAIGRSQIASARWAMVVSGATTLGVAVWYSNKALSPFAPEIALDAPPTQKTNALKYITAEEVAKRNNREDGLWVVIDKEIWDLTDFVDMHPGGAKIIERNAGKDVTKLFKPIHPPNTLRENLSPDQKVGLLDPKDVDSFSGGLSEEEERIKKAREDMPHIDTMVNLDDFEVQAMKVLSGTAIAYYTSGSDTESSMQQAGDAYKKIFFRPRVMRKVKDIDTSTTILGVPTSLPFYISPAALARLGDPDGEMNLVKGAAQKNLLYCISSYASCSLEEVCSVKETDQTLFWQFYVPPDRVKAKALLQKVVDCGMKSIWVTVDAPVGGKREKDIRLKLELDPPSDVVEKKPQSTSEQLFSGVDPDLTWEDLDWMRKIAPGLPIVIKGIGCVEDALVAVEHGCEGIVLSNHGGRQLDGSRPPIEVLQEIRKLHPEVFNKTEVFVDGGIRRGTDVLKALALGAKGVGLGRTFLYANAAYGSRGIVKAIEILEGEIITGMRLLGVTKIDQLGPELIAQ